MVYTIEVRSITYMKKRTAVIGALVSLLPLGQPLVIGTGSVLTSSAIMLFVPEQAKAENAIVYYNRGIDAQESDDHYGAISDFNNAIEIDPNYAWAYTNRGISKRQIGDNKGACNDYKKAISLGDIKTKAWFGSAGAYWCRNE